MSFIVIVELPPISIKKFWNTCAYDHHFCSLKPPNSNFGMWLCKDLTIITVIATTCFLEKRIGWSDLKKIFG